jgi:hypothetical protein
MPRMGKHRFWSGPPSTPLNNAIIQHPLMPRSNFFVGPVHTVVITDRYVAVEVPHPVLHPGLGATLVWLNIWANVNNRGETSSVYFADRVATSVVQQWHQRGWVDFWVLSDLLVTSAPR